MLMPVSGSGCLLYININYMVQKYWKFYVELSAGGELAVCLSTSGHVLAEIVNLSHKCYSKEPEVTVTVTNW